MEDHAPHYYYPNRMGRVLLQSLEDVMGRSGLLRLLNLAGVEQYINGFPANNLDKKFDFDDVSGLMRGLDLIYGPRGGRIIALRAGRVAFRYGLTDFGPVLGIADLNVHLLPWSIRLDQGAAALAGLFNQFSDQVVRLEDSDEILYWHIERCPLCWNRQLVEPRCFTAAGVLQEAMLWLSAGKDFQVEQMACRAAGQTRCSFAIYKQPLS